MSKSPMAVMQEVDEASRTLRLYAGSEAHQALIKLLDALEQHNLFALADATPETLGKQQGALRQVRQLRMAAIGGDTARI